MNLHFADIYLNNFLLCLFIIYFTLNQKYTVPDANIIEHTIKFITHHYY